jgi:putative transposase
MAKSSCVLPEQRAEFCERALRRKGAGESFQTVCQAYGISRATGYEWLERLGQAGREGLQARSRARHRPCAGAAVRRWAATLLALRAKRPTWGADKLLETVAGEHPRARLPSRSAVTRLLRRCGAAAGRPSRARRGPAVPRENTVPVEGANDLWTVDFKGWFRTGNGERCEPLTVRDLFSRFILCISPVAACSEALVRCRMRPLFQRYGLPRAIRVDNGAPFGSPTTGSALGLTRRSVWWLRLGIAVEFTRPGCPQDNGAHEQMHRVLKAETAHPPARTLAQQRRKMEEWRRDYNEQRPHAALGHGVPASFYHPEIRRYQGVPVLHYPADCVVRTVSAKGTVKWAGLVRNVGRAFSGERLGLRALIGAAAAWAVYLGGQLVAARAGPRGHAAGTAGAHQSRSTQSRAHQADDPELPGAAREDDATPERREAGKFGPRHFAPLAAERGRYAPRLLRSLRKMAPWLSARNCKKCQACGEPEMSGMW